jgi:hypothetical protein
MPSCCGRACACSRRDEAGLRLGIASGPPRPAGRAATIGHSGTCIAPTPIADGLIQADVLAAVVMGFVWFRSERAATGTCRSKPLGSTCSFIPISAPTQGPVHPGRPEVESGQPIPPKHALRSLHSARRRLRWPNGARGRTPEKLAYLKKRDVSGSFGIQAGHEAAGAIRCAGMARRVRSARPRRGWADKPRWVGSANWSQRASLRSRKNEPSRIADLGDFFQAAAAGGKDVLTIRR